MNRFDAAARSIKTVEAMQKAWRKHIGKPLTSQSALNFLQHYRRMTKKQSRSKTKHGKKQRGGAAYTLSGASTDYVMAPGQAGNAMATGFPVLAAYGPQQYGHFTDDVTSYKPLLNNVGGPAEIPKIAQLADCGVDRFPTDPRLAQVGAGYGKKRRLNRMNRSRNSSRNSSRSSRKNRKNSRSRKNRKSRKQYTRKQRGGAGLMDFLSGNPLGVNSVHAGGVDRVPGDHLGVPQYTNGTMFSVDKISTLSGMTPTNTIQSYAPAQFVSASGQLFGTAQAAAR